MRSYEEMGWESLLTRSIVNKLTEIHEYKGEHSIFFAMHPDAFAGLTDITKIQSVHSSNSMAGVFTSDDRMKKLVMDKTRPSSRDEEEIAGYRDALNSISVNFEHIFITPLTFLQLHQNLYKYISVEHGGDYRTTDDGMETNDVFEKIIESYSVPSKKIAESLERLCSFYESAVKQGIDPLIAIPIFILDFLSIHPFNRGNGRISRLLLMLLLYKEGYTVGKYISIDEIMKMNQDGYCEAMQQSIECRSEGRKDYKPFVDYTLDIILYAYRQLSDQIKSFMKEDMSKPAKVEKAIKKKKGEITKSELIKLCPDVSITTIERTLVQLQRSDKITKIGGGRYTSYVWNSEVSK